MNTRHRFLSRSGRTIPILAILGALTAPGCDRSPPSGEDHGGGDPAGHAAHGPVNGAAAAPAEQPVAPGEWCFEHGVPEAVCTRCNPSLIDSFKEKRDWCRGHGLPESQCVLCNPEVEAYWASLRPREPQADDPPEHRPEPAPDTADTQTPGAAAGMTVERVAHALRPENDPLCNIESSRVRFLDASIAGKAGIAVEPARPRPLSVVIEALGELRYDETRLARVTARMGGVIMEVPSQIGNAVQAGELMAVIESAELGTAKSDYVNAYESWRLARADLERHDHLHDAIETLIDAATEPVSTDELRRRFDGVRIGAAKSRILGAHAQLELARTRFERETGLLERGITSMDSFQTAQRDLQTAESNFAATQESVDLEMEKEHLDLTRSLAVTEIELNAARRRLQIFGVGDEEIATLDQGRVDALSRYEIRAPIDGRVVARTAVVGEAVSPGDALFSVADLSTVWLWISLDERDLVSVRLGAPVLFSVDGIAGRSFEGTVDWISSEVDDRTRTVHARASLSNEDGLLRANMFGRVRVIAHRGEELLTVPADAVQTDGCCSLVFVRESDTLFHPRKVVLGPAASGYVQILDGLKEGQSVVTTGSFLLKTEILKGSIGAGCCEVDPGR